MHVRTILAAGILAAAALTGIGSGAGAASGEALGAGAALVPADAAAFVSIDSNVGSSQWQALGALLAKIPQHDTLVTQLQQSFEQKTGLNWSTDVRPALGPELDVAVLPAATGGKPLVVVLTQPPSQTALASLLQKLASGGHPAPVSAQVGDGWTAISDSQAALDAVTGATTRLASDSTYQDATTRLAPVALMTAYANGAEARQLVTAAGGQVGSGHVAWAAADAVAASGGLDVHGFVSSDVPGLQPYSSTLVDKIPGDALAVADFQAGQVSPSGSAPSSPLGSALAELRGALGGETALYVTPASPIPAVTLVTNPSDPAAVLAALKDVLAAAGSAAAGSAAGGATAGGLDLGSLLGAIQLSHEQLGSTLVVSTSQQAIDAFSGSGSKLADAGAFADSGIPAQTTGFVYVNLQAALPAVQGLLALAGGSSTTGGVDLGALQTLTAYGTGPSGGVSEFTVFLAVQ